MRQPRSSPILFYWQKIPKFFVITPIKENLPYIIVIDLQVNPQVQIDIQIHRIDLFKCFLTFRIMK